MNEKLRKFFSERKIEYFVPLAYADCRVTSPHIMEREELVPRSVIVFLVPYYTGECVNMSRYAASLDYHIYLRRLGGELTELLRAEYPNARFCVYGDHSPIDERHAAAIGGLGIMGDNALLINEKYGSYVFIGDVITDIPPEQLGAVTPLEPRTCMHCSACKDVCPTGILRGECCTCLSAITQRKGELTATEAELMRKFNTVWGCDECQSHCPYNSSVPKTPIEFFFDERISELTNERLASMSREEFSKRAFAWRGRKTVERNLDILYGK